MIPSPKVATYDLQPEMSAYTVTDEVVERIESGKYDAIILNFANCDMVGHTGNFEASVAQDFQGIGSATADAVARVLGGDTIKQSVIYVPTKLITAANVGD